MCNAQINGCVYFAAFVEESPLSPDERQLPNVIIIIILVMYIYSHDITKLVGAFPSERSPSYLIGYVNVSWNNR